MIWTSSRYKWVFYLESISYLTWIHLNCVGNTGLNDQSNHSIFIIFEFAYLQEHILMVFLSIILFHTLLFKILKAIFLWIQTNLLPGDLSNSQCSIQSLKAFWHITVSLGNCQSYKYYEVWHIWIDKLSV